MRQMRRTGYTQVDAIIVGAGPSGSMAAHTLASGGARVVVLEEHEQIGSPCHCAGLVSPRTLALAGESNSDRVLRSFDRARVWGPKGSVAWLESNKVQALAIDRADFDRSLAARAQEDGAQIWLGVRAESFERVNGDVHVVAVNGKGRERLKAPILIGADGVRSQVAHWFTTNANGVTLPAMKADVRFDRASTEDIEIFVGNEIAPGWFAWIIPIGSGLARLGLGGQYRDLRHRFSTFLDLVRERFGSFTLLDQRGWLIPVHPASQIAFDHGLLVGDAARQAKPSSGGGIYMGMRAGILAAETTLDAFGGGNFGYDSLRRYEDAWCEQEGDELRYNHWLRSIYNRMSDDEIDQLVALCNRPWARLLIRRLGDIDFASKLFKPIHLALETLAPRLLGKLSDKLQGSNVVSMEQELSSLELDPDSIFGEYGS
jgi:digeranylgeranylglycerophospholipid reductase